MDMGRSSQPSSALRVTVNTTNTNANTNGQMQLNGNTRASASGGQGVVLSDKAEKTHVFGRPGLFRLSFVCCCLCFIHSCVCADVNTQWSGVTDETALSRQQFDRRFDVDDGTKPDNGTGLGFTQSQRKQSQQHNGASPTHGQASGTVLMHGETGGHGTFAHASGLSSHHSHHSPHHQTQTLTQTQARASAHGTVTIHTDVPSPERGQKHSPGSSPSIDRLDHALAATRTGSFDVGERRPSKPLLTPMKRPSSTMAQHRSLHNQSPGLTSTESGTGSRHLSVAHSTHLTTRPSAMSSLGETRSQPDDELAKHPFNTLAEEDAIDGELGAKIDDDAVDAAPI